MSCNRWHGKINKTTHFCRKTSEQPSRSSMIWRISFLSLIFCERFLADFFCISRASSVLGVRRFCIFTLPKRNTSKQKNSAYSFPYTLFYQLLFGLSINVWVVTRKWLFFVFFSSPVYFIKPRLPCFVFFASTPASWMTFYTIFTWWFFPCS